jgi:hypothetical protein
MANHPALSRTVVKVTMQNPLILVHQKPSKLEISVISLMLGATWQSLA